MVLDTNSSLCWSISFSISVNTVVVSWISGMEIPFIWQNCANVPLLSRTEKKSMTGLNCFIFSRYSLFAIYLSVFISDSMKFFKSNSFVTFSFLGTDACPDSMKGFFAAFVCAFLWPNILSKMPIIRVPFIAFPQETRFGIPEFLKKIFHPILYGWVLFWIQFAVVIFFWLQGSRNGSCNL